VKVNTVSCGGSKPNMTGSVVLKILKVGIWSIGMRCCGTADNDFLSQTDAASAPQLVAYKEIDNSAEIDSF
jgi:hypothetical protein